jgi:putative photosynthetic complex assembly protein
MPPPKDRVMTDRSELVRFPTLPLLGAAALVLGSLAVAGVSRTFDVGTSRLSYANPAASRDIRFEDREDGTVAVLAADNGRIIGLMSPGTNGFVRIVMRGLARDRLVNGVDSGPPFTLTRWADGRLTISDSATERRVELTGFGKDNVNAFASLLASEEDAK